MLEISTSTGICRDPETAVIHFWLPGGVRYGRCRCYTAAGAAVTAAAAGAAVANLVIKN